MKINQKWASRLTMVVVIMCLNSCYYDEVLPPEVEVPIDTVSYAISVEPIFDQQGCTACHPPIAQLDLSAGNSYASIMDGHVDTENPENSRIYTIALPGEDHPQTYTAQQAVIILTWIQQGALDN